MALTVTVPATATRLTTLERVTEELGLGAPAAPLPATASYLVTTRVIADGSQPIASQPDVPRNATITVTDADVSITAGTVTINGVDQLGAVQAEALDLAVALTFTGTVLWASITSVVVAGLVGNGATDTLAVGIGSSIYVDALTSTSPTALQAATINRMIDEASAAIAAYCHRVFGRETVAETLGGTNRRTMGLSRTPLVSVASVYEDGVLLTPVSPTDFNADTGGYYVEDAACSALGRDIGWFVSVAVGWDRVAYDTGYITPLFRRWRYAVTYTAGWVLPEEPSPNLPGGIERACVETVKMLWAGRNTPDPSIASEQLGDIRIGYRDATTPNAKAYGGQIALPDVAVGLLAPWRVELGGV